MASWLGKSGALRLVASTAVVSAAVVLATRPIAEVDQAHSEGYLSLLQTRSRYTTRPGVHVQQQPSHTPILEFLSAFRPCAICTDPVRLGAVADGGYLMCGELLPNVTAAYSYGIEGRDEWGADISTRLGVTVHQFDCFHTAKPECPAERVCNFEFNPVCVGERIDHDPSERTFAPLRDQLHARGHDENGSGNLVMKIDIEGSEWALFARKDNQPLLRRFSQIIAELHWVGAGKHLTGHEELQRAAMHNLLEDFVVVHLHENNRRNMYEIDGYRIGRIVEVTFVRRDLVHVGPCIPDPPQDGGKNMKDMPDLPPAHLPGGTQLSFSPLRLPDVDDVQPAALARSQSDTWMAANFLPDATLPDDEYYPALRSRILETCGETCRWKKPARMGRFFNHVVERPQCSSMFTKEMQFLDGLSKRWPPPRTIPSAFVDDFKMYEPALEVEDLFLEENQGSAPGHWTRSEIDSMARAFKAGDFTKGGYTEAERRMVYGLVAKHATELDGKHCAVLGSHTPWLEAMLLSAGVTSVTTIEYATITSDHPNVTSMHPSEWSEWYKMRQPTDLFDCVVSYSSLEHAGLGRYGDIINPWGDLIAMAKLTCSLKENGLILIGFPTGKDAVAWNAHRYYGPKRWAQMLAGTEQLEYEVCEQSRFSQGVTVARKLPSA